MKLKTILTSAYMLDPFAGMDEGAVWHFIYQMARYQKVIVLTQLRNKEILNIYMSEFPDEIYRNLHFVYFELDSKKSKLQNSAATAWLYEYLWHKALPGFVKEKKLQFDIIHQLSYGSKQTGCLYKLDKPLVWGPIKPNTTHVNQIQKVNTPASKLLNLWKDFLKKLVWNFSPRIQNTIHKADHIVCMNKNASHLIENKNISFSILPSIAALDKGYSIHFAPGHFTLISAGTILPNKGFDLSILAFADFLCQLTDAEKKNIRFLIAGNGSHLPSLKNMVTENKLETYVECIEHPDPSELNTLLKNSSAFIFPSQYGSGMIIAEALSHGIPVISLSNSEHGTIISEKCGFTITSGNYQETIKELSHAIKELYSNKKTLLRMSLNAREQFETMYDWNIRGNQLKTIYTSLSPDQVVK